MVMDWRLLATILSRCSVPQFFNSASTLLKEPIIAWEHGPVVESLYHQYKDYGAGEIPQPDSVNLADFNPDQIELLDEVFDVYGQFSAWKLRNMTHSEKPWLETPKNSEIPQALMQSFFKTLLK